MDMLRINAFTSVEVAMACVLIAIAMGLGYLGLSSVQQLARDYQERQERRLDILRTRSWLQSDLRSCSRITWQDSSLLLFMQHDTIRYSQERGRLTRLRNDVCDTMIRGVSSMELLYGEVGYHRSGCPWSEVGVRLSGGAEPLTIRATKHYSAQEIITQHGGSN